MLINISQNHKTYVKERDLYREKMFRDVHKISCHISSIDVLDGDGNWVRNDIKFHINGKDYKLIEFFKEGNDNSTDFVNFEYANDIGALTIEKFNRHKEAEDRMVEVIKIG